MNGLCVLLLLLVFCVFSNVSVAQPNSSLSDLNDFDKIEKLMPFGNHEKPSPERLYIRSLRDRLANTPISERPGVLRKLSDQTKWGTSQRFISYYICAWYGINYDRTRDYLIHAAYWWEWRIDPESARPFNFAEVSTDLLYALYERNHDLKILHDILTTKSDAAGETAILAVTGQAIARHPRDILHVATMSAKGHNLVWKLLHLSPNEPGPLREWEGTKETHEFRIYVKSVANNSKDPLSILAKGLLKKPRRGCQ